MQDRMSSTFHLPSSCLALRVSNHLLMDKLHSALLKSTEMECWSDFLGGGQSMIQPPGSGLGPETCLKIFSATDDNNKILNFCLSI